MLELLLLFSFASFALNKLGELKELESRDRIRELELELKVQEKKQP